MWIRSKSLSLVLVFTMLFVYAAPQLSLASSSNNSSGTTAQPPSAILHKNVTRLTELVDKRDQYSKTYLNSDGSYTVETSKASRHYKDANGKWQDISNKLIPSDDPTAALRNEANSFQTYFAKNSQANYIAKVKLDQNTLIGWNLNNSNKVNALNDTNGTTYPEILPNTDVQYQPFSDGLKENIILKNISAPNSFSFQLTATGLTPINQSDGSIVLQDSKTGVTKLTIPTPYMIDNNHVISKAVSMTIVPVQTSNTYILNVTGDLGWLGDPSRAYPVTLDPTVSNQNWSTTISTGSDTFVAEYAKDTQYSVNNYMTTGYDGVNNGRTRALVKFPMPTLPTGSIVTDGIMSLYKYTTTGATSEQLIARRVISSWPYTVTWNTQPTIDSTYTQTEASLTSIAGSYTGWVNFNVWSIAKGWINGGLENDGIEIQHNTESDPLFFYYSSNDPSGLGPLLSITYISDQTGLNPYWSYANTDGGSVNTFNGNFLTSVTDFSLPGRGIPITVARTFNSRGSLNGLFGQKWFSNLDQQLKFPSNPSWGVVYLDSTGTERPFMLNSDGLTYTRPDNYPVQLYKYTSGGQTYYHVQEANSETGAYSTNLPTLTFDSTGRLIKIEDGKQNTTNVTWNMQSSPKTIVVQDPSSRTATITLNASNYVDNIKSSAESGVVKASYIYSNGYLASVTYDNGTYPSATVNYEWSGSNLFSFTDKLGNKTYLNYDGTNRLISTGPINALANPSFEANANGIDPNNWSKSIQQDAGSIQLSTTAKYAGKSLDLHSVYQSGTSGTSRLLSKQQIPVSAGKPYVLSSLIKTAGLTGNAIAYLNIEEVDSNQNHLAWEDTSANPVIGTTDWTQKSLSITTTASTAYLNVYVEVSHDPNSFGGDAYFDGVQLQDGITTTVFQGHNDFQYGTDNSFAACWLSKAAGELSEYKSNNYGTPVAVIGDPYGLKSETDMVWDASDHLRNLTTPEQVKLGASGKSYAYTYDALGNMLSATDPLNHITSMNYYYNRLNTLTQPDNSTVTNVWNPVNLNQDSSINQTGNSTAYVHDSAGNTTSQSNQLGLADNRVYNSGFEGPVTPSLPTFSRNSTAYLKNWSLVSANTPRYETGKFGQGVTIEEGTTNLLNTQGGGANSDWSKWLHWGNRSYWSSESQTSDPSYGMVYTGVNANSTNTYLFDYYPYSVTNGAPYTISLLMKSSQNWTGNITSYMIRSSDGANVANTTTQSVSLTGSWQLVTFTMTANQTLANSVGFGLKLAGLPVGVSLSAARPQLEQNVNATSYTDSSRSGEVLTVPTANIASPNQGTVETWVNVPTTWKTGISGWRRIWSIGNNYASGMYGAYYNPSDNKIHFMIYGSSANDLTTTTMPSSGWHLFSTRWSVSEMALFIDGVKIGSLNTPSLPSSFQNSLVAIGGRTDNGDLGDTQYDDFRISSISRSDTELTADYTSNQPLPTDTNTTYKLNFDNNLNFTNGNYQPTDWSAYSQAGTINQVEYDSTAPFGGSNVLHINPGNNNNAYQWTDYMPVDYNYPYTLSAYLRANGTAATPNGACINLYWYDSSHNQINSPPPQPQVYFDARSNQWQRYIAANITPPPGATYAKVAAITYGQYDGYFDNIQLEQSPQARGYNFLDNSSFIRGNVRWNFSDGNASIVSDGSSFSNIYDGKVNRSTTGTSYLESQVTPTVNQGQYYTIYGFIKTNGITATSGNGARIHVVIVDNAGNQLADYAMPNPVNINDPNWTKYSYAFKPSVSGRAKVRLELTNATGTAYFDDIRLSPGNLVSTAAYDADKNYATSTTDQLNRTTTFSYTANSYGASNNYGQATTVTANSGEQTQFTYDGQERLRSATDNANNTAIYTLNANGNVTDVSLAAGTSTYDHGTFAYDSLDNLTTETDANGKISTYSYDEEGRLTTKTFPNSSTVTLSYDSLNHVKQMTLSSGASYSYTYNLEGKPTEIKVYSGATLTNDFTYSYDAMGNLTSYSEGSGQGQVNSITRDVKDRITAYNLVNGTNTIPNSFTYAKNDLPQTVTADNKNFSLIYDDGDNLINRGNPNNTKDIYTYNDANQISRVQTVDTSQGLSLLPKWSSNYSFDSDGRISGISGTRPSVTVTSFSESYTYNNGTEKLNRLTQATIDGNVYNYQYDPAGNITSMAVPSGSGTATNVFTYDADNRISTVNGDSTAVSYDDNGNLLKLILNGTTRYYTYDSANRLTAVGTTSGASDIASYTYDSDGKRLTKTVGSTTTTYHYFQGQLMYETVGTTITALYLRSSDGRLLGVRLYQNGVNNYYYYHYNAQGDVVAVTDSNGAVYRQYVYDPYGNVISVKDGSGTAVDINNDTGFNNAYTYRGYRYDSESGLYFLNARYYAAGIGRFLTKDKVLGAQNNPQTLNRYAYCGGDPVNRIDPTGTSWFSAIVKAVTGIFNLIFGVPAVELGDPEPLSIGAQELSEAGSDVMDEVGPEISKVVSQASTKVAHAKNLIKDYLGPNVKATVNKSKDLILRVENNDFVKKVRFDINNPSPHSSPHAHVEEFIQELNKLVPTFKSGPIYPSDVPPQ